MRAVRQAQGIFGVLIAGVAGGILFLPAIYFIGLAIAPPRPSPGDGARVSRGRRRALGPGQRRARHRAHAHLTRQSWRSSPPAWRSRISRTRRPVTRGASRRAGDYLPAMQGVEYLSTVHMRDANLKPSFREGISRFATSVWLTRSWTKSRVPRYARQRGEFGARAAWRRGGVTRTTSAGPPAS